MIDETEKRPELCKNASNESRVTSHPCNDDKPHIMSSTVFECLLEYTSTMLPHERKALFCFDRFSYETICPWVKTFWNLRVTDNKEGVLLTPPSHIIVMQVKFLSNGIYQNIGTFAYFDYTERKFAAKALLEMMKDVRRAGLHLVASCSSGQAENIMILSEMGLITSCGNLLNYSLCPHHQIIHVFDPSWLMRKLRGEFFTNDIKFKYRNQNLTASYKYIAKLLATPSQKIFHANIYNKRARTTTAAVKLFSQTVHSLLDKVEDCKRTSGKSTVCQNTQTLVDLFDQLFDSFNSLWLNKNSEKVLRSAMTMTSLHLKLWANAVPVLETMRFVPKVIKKARVIEPYVPDRWDEDLDDGLLDFNKLAEVSKISNRKIGNEGKTKKENESKTGVANGESKGEKTVEEKRIANDERSNMNKGKVDENRGRTRRGKRKKNMPAETIRKDQPLLKQTQESDQERNNDKSNNAIPQRSKGIDKRTREKTKNDSINTLKVEINHKHEHVTTAKSKKNRKNNNRKENKIIEMKPTESMETNNNIIETPTTTAEESTTIESNQHPQKVKTSAILLAEKPLVDPNQLLVYPADEYATDIPLENKIADLSQRIQNLLDISPNCDPAAIKAQLDFSPPATTIITSMRDSLRKHNGLKKEHFDNFVLLFYGITSHDDSIRSNIGHTSTYDYLSLDNSNKLFAVYETIAGDKELFALRFVNVLRDIFNLYSYLDMSLFDMWIHTIAGVRKMFEDLTTYHSFEALDTKFINCDSLHYMMKRLMLNNELTPFYLVEEPVCGEPIDFTTCVISLGPDNQHIIERDIRSGDFTKKY